MRDDTIVRLLDVGRETRLGASARTWSRRARGSPGDGTVIDGIASVDESAVTGETSHVLREPSGERNGATSGSRVLSGRLTIKIGHVPLP